MRKLRKLLVFPLLLLACAAVQAGRDGPKFLPEYTNISCRGVVTGFGMDYNYGGVNYVYLQRPDRAYGIKVYQIPYVYAGDLLQVNGFLWTDLYTGEQCLIAEQSQALGSGYLPRPVYMPQKWLGGNSLGYNYGVSGGFGLNNIGLLAKTTGNVTQETYWGTAGYETIVNDGSNLPTGLPGVTGVRFLDPYFLSYWELGQKVSVTGISVPWLYWEDGIVYPALLQLEDYDSVMPQRSSQNTTLQVSITGGPANGEAQLSSDSCSKTVEFDQAGNASIKVSLKAGQHTLTCKAYNHATKLAAVDLAPTGGTLNLSLKDIEEQIVLDIPYNVMQADGQEQLVIKGIICDEEGYRAPAGMPIISTLNNGTIISADAVTDKHGEFEMVVQSSTEFETGVLTISSGSVAEYYCLFFADLAEEGPVVWPEEVMQNQVVSGNVHIRLHAMDYTEPDPNAYSEVNAHAMNLYGYSMKIDGQQFHAGIPYPDEEIPEYPYPLVDGVLETELYSNGPHTLTVTLEDADGNEFEAATYTLIFDNDMSGVSIDAGGENVGEIDLAANDLLTVSASFKTETQWRVAAYDLDEGALVNETIIEEGIGTQLLCTWDGRLPGWQSDEVRSDMVYVQIWVNEEYVAGSESHDAETPDSLSWPWKKKKKKKVNVKPFADSQCEAILFQGASTEKDPGKDYVGNFGYRSECFYQRLKAMGYKVRRLSLRSATSTRVMRILGNGKCRMLYYMGHAGYSWRRKAKGEPKEYFTYICLSDSYVLSKHMDGGVANFEDLGLMHTSQILFAFFDGCNTGQGQGNTSNPPLVPDGQKNDMAKRLGMYHLTGGGRVYLGWYGPVYSDKNTNNFIGAWCKKAPYGKGRGMFDLWTSPGDGRVLSYVIGRYPNAYTCPYILYSANQPPAEWHWIWLNLRIFGIGSFGDNLGMNERMFNLTP